MLYASKTGTSNDDNNDSLEKFDSQKRKFQLVQAFSLALQKFFKPYLDKFLTVIEQNNQVIANHSNSAFAQKKSMQKGFRYLYDMFQGLIKGEVLGNQKIIIEQNSKIIELLEHAKEDDQYQIAQHNKTQALLLCQENSIDNPDD